MKKSFSHLLKPIVHNASEIESKLNNTTPKNRKKEASVL